LSNEFNKVLQRIEKKLDDIVIILKERFTPIDGLKFSPNISSVPSNDVINVYLLKLPDSLKKTMLAMIQKKEASASELAKLTKRSRSLESIHLNQLERMGYIEKYRKGKKVFFLIPNITK
jgi:DNA-binding transcriptional ArsR family regulator